MSDRLLSQVLALRQDLETQTAINIVEGINTAETMALLGHWIQKQRLPTAAELMKLEKLARKRWTSQVKQAVALARREPGGLDRSLSVMLGTLGDAGPGKAKAKPRPPARKRPRKR